MRIVTVIALAIALGAPAFAQDADDDDFPIPENRVFGEAPSGALEEIDDVLERFGRAWGSEDVDGLLELYAPDIEWINAYGVVRRGHDELGTFLSMLFEHFDASIAAEETESRRPVSTRFLGSDTAVCHVYVESRRTENRDGDGSRGIHITYVLSKQSGRWLIVHHMIMDARL